jgi:type I restriction enzyme R subunit
LVILAGYNFGKKIKDTITDYVKNKNSSMSASIPVEDIDTKELLESSERIEKIVEYIIANHDRKTHSKEFTAMMCVSSVEVFVNIMNYSKRKNTI